MQLQIKKGELWWGGYVTHGMKMPLSADSDYSIDLRYADGNQSSPLFLSNQGRYIWSEEPFKITFHNGMIEIDGDVSLFEAGSTLREAYLTAMGTHFPFTGKVPPKEFFGTAQYNTWIEFMYNQNQKGILEYAHNLLDAGFQPGILTIDEGWAENYGMWRFRLDRFPDPKAMIEELHRLGFTVMLWVVPTVSPDSSAFRELANKPEHLLRNKDGTPALIRWWNGYSTALDFTREADWNWLDRQLQDLMQNYGVDGFKFDGGSLGYYQKSENGELSDSADNAARNIAWNEFGERYTFHEYKDTWKGGGKPVIQRLRDKNHAWGVNGLAQLIPDAILQGLLGYPFTCPDMIGGGEYSNFLKPDFQFDGELFVRMAQCSVFFPMMQFSLAPWRVLQKDTLDLVRSAEQLHGQMAEIILEEVCKTAVSGEPLIRSMEYQYPHRGYAHIVDQFCFGDGLLVAPILEKGATTRTVLLPDGIWTDDEGKVWQGGGAVTVEAPLDRLPYFIKKRAAE